MFCSKCGNKLPENAGFCPDCGTKLAVGESFNPQNIGEETSYSQNEVGSFKEYVDAHICKSTEFQSVEDLINKSEPWGFVKKTVCIFALIGLVFGIVEGNMGYILLMVILGVPTALCIGPCIVSVC